MIATAIMPLTNVTPLSALASLQNSHVAKALFLCFYFYQRSEERCYFRELR
jgi:hypothetical protein